MTLSENDGKLFYKLWFPLLDYVNTQKLVNPNLRKIESPISVDIHDVKEVANVLWSETSLIDAYLDEHKEIIGDERAILLSWKRCLSGQFVLERILKKGAILISETNEVYQAVGIVSSWEEMFHHAPLPLFLKATLLPFRSMIISDGLIQTYNILMGKNMARPFKDTYMDAKKSGRIHRQL